MAINRREAIERYMDLMIDMSSECDDYREFLKEVIEVNLEQLEMTEPGINEDEEQLL